MRKTLFLILTAVGVLAGAGAAAAANHKVDTNGFGMATTDTDGGVVISGTAAGAPFDGPFTATLAAADGSLPAPGECEPATATLRVNGTRSRFVELSSVDDVCGQYLDPPNVVSQVFTGRYTVTASSQRRLVGTDGFYEVRLTSGNSASVFAIDT
jgi:hypothetical protein